MTKFMITNFQSQNVRSPLIVKQERSLHVPKWNNCRAYICYRKTISTQTVQKGANAPWRTDTM